MRAGVMVALMVSCAFAPSDSFELPALLRKGVGLRKNLPAVCCRRSFQSLRSTDFPCIRTSTPRSLGHPLFQRLRDHVAALRSVAGGGEDFVRSQRLDELDEADLMLQTGESYLPFEGDIVEYVDSVDNESKLGMILEDAHDHDGFVRVRQLQRREGSGEFDEWLCFARGGGDALATVAVEAVRYCGSCTGLVELDDDDSVLDVDEE